jgi:hypothetical protein
MASFTSQEQRASTSPASRKGLRRLLLIGCTSLLLAAVAFTLVATYLHAPAAAATGNPYQLGRIAPPQLTAREIALNTQKQALAQEYMRVLHGQEVPSLFETHMIALMKQRGISYSSRLQTVMGHLGKFHSSLCPSIANILCPVYAAQFPEMKSYYCGVAAASTILVEDSFSWGSGILTTTRPNTNITDHLTYDAYIISQPSSYANADEDLLANSSYMQTDQDGGTNFGPMESGLNDWVGGNGGWYNTVWQGNVPGSFQNDLVTDINTGWDIAGGLHIIDQTGYATLAGYAGHGEFYHWIPITSYANSGTTTYYNDPIYASPDYTSWHVPGPIASTTTINMIAILERMGYIW